MIINARFTLSVLLVCFFCVVSLPVAAADSKPPKLFEQSSEMKVTLSGPWRYIERNVEDDAMYPAQLTYTGSDGQRHTIDVEVTPRGISRRLRVCDFPPLKVHFDKDKMKGTEFRGNKSLKLVTYCDRHSKYQQYYVKEFLVYRIYNLITEYSFRVRPLSIEYVDSQKGGDSLIRFGFLIEDLDDVADRNDVEKLSIAKIPVKDLDPTTTSHMSLFQYMVGNLDWAATDGPEEDSCCHNTKLIGKGNDQIPKYSVPYDFDSTGLVDAHYAAPPAALRMRNIRQRLYRGLCYFNDSLPQSTGLFNDKKADILALFETNAYLTDKTKKKAVEYLEEFYQVINNPKLLQKEIIDKCRGPAR